jgi:hypothetical protein
MIYIDGEEKPSIIGTGTEDYFSSGWYFDRGQYSAPFHGVVMKDEKLGRISAYRWHIEDAMPYEKSIKVTIEHGHNNEAEADYSSVAYYYEFGPAKPFASIPSEAKDLLPYIPPEPKKMSGAIEGEDLVPSAKATSGPVEVQHMDAFAGEYSAGAQLFWRPERAGETLTIDLPVKEAGDCDVIAHFVKAADYARIGVSLNEGSVTTVDLYHDGVIPSGPVSLGRVKLNDGKNRLVITVVDKNERSKGYFVGLDAVVVKAVR